MGEKFFLSLNRLIRENRVRVIVALLLITAIATLTLSFQRFRGDVDIMLPDDREIRRSLSFMRESNLSDKVVFSLSLNDGNLGKKELFDAVDQLAAGLKPPMFTEIISGFQSDALMDEEFLGVVAQVASKDDLSAIDRELDREHIALRLKGIYMQSLKPESVFMSGFSRSDPLGLRMQLLKKLKVLSDSMGYEVVMEGGHLVSRDGRHALLIAQTSVSMTDGPGCRKLVSVIEEEIGRLPSSISVDTIGGHLHTVSNERVIERDIKLTSMIASVAFLVLFLLVFRDMRVGFVFILPMFAVIYSVVISGFMFGSLSTLVIGFGSAIAGITVDYGIYIYIAARKGLHGEQQSVRHAKLIFIDGITSIAGFGVLLLSHIEGYRQLGIFSIVCIAGSMILAVFILPVMLMWNRDGAAANPYIERGVDEASSAGKAVVVVWAVLTAVLFYYSFHVRIDSDVSQLDGSEKYVIDAERRFHETWGGLNNQAILVVSGKTFEEALERSDMVYQQVMGPDGVKDFISLSMLWPSEKKRKENLDRWNSFWRDGREDKLKSLVRAEGGRYQFSDDAFSPFYDNLYGGSLGAAGADELIGRMKDRFIQKRNGGYQVLSFFPDERDSLLKVDAIIKEQPGSYIFSRKALSGAISAYTAKEGRLLVTVAIIANILLTALFFRNIKATIIALLPVATSVISLLGVLSILDIPINVANLVAGIITTGIVVDFGIGVTYEYYERLKLGTVLGVSFSAICTIIGAGVLLFTNHPALFSIGLAMCISLVTGWFSSVLVVPVLCNMWLDPGRKGGKA